LKFFSVCQKFTAVCRKIATSWLVVFNPCHCVLLAYYVTVVVVDDCGVTPLLAAALNDHLETCVLLVRSNSLLDVVGDVKLSAGVQRQLTALHAAIERHHFVIARLLLAAGASCKSIGTQPPQHLLKDEDSCLSVLLLSFGRPSKPHYVCLFIRPSTWPPHSKRKRRKETDIDSNVAYGTSN